MMKSDSLKETILTLTEIEANGSPFVSCFLDLQHPRADLFGDVEAEAGIAARGLSGQARTDFYVIMSEIRTYLRESLEPNSKSVAIYARWGEEPVFVAVQFEVPMASKVLIGELPHIYPLVELKDTYHRFVIVVTTENQVRIMETSIGSVTEEILSNRPELRERVGREWTRNRYRNHKRDRGEKFVREKVRILDELVAERGHSHLIVAGSPKMVARLTNSLPARLKDKLVTSMTSNPKAGLDPILLEAINAFAEAENMESHDVVEKLNSALMSDGLGVAGYEAAIEALEGGYADVLIVSQSYNEEERERLVRMATTRGVEVETVRDSALLDRLSGVGCLLRYQPDPGRTLVKKFAA